MTLMNFGAAFHGWPDLPHSALRMAIAAAVVSLIFPWSLVLISAWIDRRIV